MVIFDMTFQTSFPYVPVVNGK